MNTVELENIYKKFDGFSLENVSFTIKKGFITGFIGPNGAGKTTTISMIMNIINQDSGTIKLFGNENKNGLEEVKQRIGIVNSENQFNKNLTVRQVKKIVSAFYNNWDEEIFETYREQFNLPLNKQIKNLSRGMVTQLSLSLALSHHAELIIMDEPTSGLDPITRREILYMLSDVIQDENKAIFFSSHIITDLEQIADYLVYIQNGKIIFNDNKEVLKERYYIVKGAKELLDKDLRKYFIRIRETSTGFEGLVNQPGIVKKIMGDYVIMEPASLEDIMFYTARS